MAIELAQVQRTFKKLRKSLNKLPSRPEPEQVHKLRTRSRRVESLLEALGLNNGRDRRFSGSSSEYGARRARYAIWMSSH